MANGLMLLLGYFALGKITRYFTEGFWSNDSFSASVYYEFYQIY